VSRREARREFSDGFAMSGFIDRFSERLDAVGCWCFAGATVLIWFEVALRYLLSAPTVWMHELVGALVSSAFLIGGAVCMRRGQHIRIGLLVDGARPLARRLAAMLALVAGVIFLAGLLWGAAVQLIDSLSVFDDDGRWMPETTGRAWDVPLPPVLRAVLVFAAAIFLLQTLVTQLRTLREIAR
jgi:TRAP-type C4-dicarboxylate transport system permease small subunit